MTNQKVSNRISLVVILGIFLFSCEKDPTPINTIISKDYVEGILFLDYVQSGFDLKIETSHEAKFYSSPDKKTFPISESGESRLVVDQGVYWIDVVWEDKPQERQTIPVYINRNKKEAINTVVALKAMKTNFSGYVLVFRHTDATVGMDKPDSPVVEWWKSCDPEIARQLNEEGKENSRKIGASIKKLNIPLAGSLSSEFCRAVQTIEFMDLDVEIVKVQG